LIYSINISIPFPALGAADTPDVENQPPDANSVVVICFQDTGDIVVISDDTDRQKLIVVKANNFQLQVKPKIPCTTVKMLLQNIS